MNGWCLASRNGAGSGVFWPHTWVAVGHDRGSAVGLAPLLLLGETTRLPCPDRADAAVPGSVVDACWPFPGPVVAAALDGEHAASTWPPAPGGHQILPPDPASTGGERSLRRVPHSHTSLEAQKDADGGNRYPPVSRPPSRMPRLRRCPTIRGAVRPNNVDVARVAERLNAASRSVSTSMAAPRRGPCQSGHRPARPSPIRTRPPSRFPATHAQMRHRPTRRDPPGINSAQRAQTIVAGRITFHRSVHRLDATRVGRTSRSEAAICCTALAAVLCCARPLERALPTY